MRCRAYRGIFIDVVYVNQPRLATTDGIDFAGLQRERRVALPEHHPFAPALIDEDDCECVSCAWCDVGVLGIDAARLQLTPYEFAVLVVACHADVPGAQPHRRARAQCGRRLSAAQNGVMRYAQLGGLRVGMRELGQAVNVVDRVSAHADDVEHGTSICKCKVESAKCEVSWEVRGTKFGMQAESCDK